MKPDTNRTVNWKHRAIIGGFVIAALVIVSARLTTKDHVLADGAAVTFPSPEEAGAALATAAGRGDEAELVKILGPEIRPLLSAGGRRVRQSRDSFVRSQVRPDAPLGRDGRWKSCALHWSG